MRLPHVRFTIRSLMVAVAVVAGLLSLFRWPAWPLVVFCWPNLMCAAMIRRRFRGYRRLAALGFGVVATAANVACAALSICYQDWGGLAIEFLGWFLSFPFILGLGAAWSAPATRSDAIRLRAPPVAWPLVLVLTFLPLTIVFTQWPFRLAFLASRPALNRLADEVAIGQAPRGPVRGGLFLVVSSVIDPSTGNVALITDPNPGGRVGFIRYHLDPVRPEGVAMVPSVTCFTICDCPTDGGTSARTEAQWLKYRWRFAVDNRLRGAAVTRDPVTRVVGLWSVLLDTRPGPAA